MATLSACDTITRPTFPGSSEGDTLPPQIQIVQPLPGDTVVASGTNVPVRVEAHDPSGLTVDIEVTGAVAFAVPPQTPDDTMIGVAFVIPIAAGKAGPVLLTANATDGLAHKSTKTFAFVVK